MSISRMATCTLTHKVLGKVKLALCLTDMPEVLRGNTESMAMATVGKIQGVSKSVLPVIVTVQCDFHW
jgi:hypothetical protein